MNRFFILIVLALSLQCCTREEGDRPEIKKDKLVDVLVDIHLTDGYLSITGYRIDRDREKIEGAYGYVLDKYGITPKQFLNTMKYYSNHVSDYENIYNSVIEKLTKMEVESESAISTKESIEDGALTKPQKNSKDKKR